MVRHIWTKEELEFLREVYPYYPNKEIAEMLKDKFGFEVTDKQLANARKNNDLPKKVIPNSGCYREGDVPWNKGRKMPEETKKKLEKTWFQKGQTTHNHRPLGSTRIDKDGYKLIKIAEPNKWALYHRYLYEKAHGIKLAKNEAVIFADGDRSNFDIDNLVKVSRANLLYLNNNNLIFDDSDLTKAGVNVSKVAEKIFDLKKGGLNEAKASI